jgi:hypothetical protein
MPHDRRLYANNPSLSSGEAMTREGGTSKQLKFARDELEAFASTTYRALIDGGQSESLTFMCRIDIGVMHNPETERLEYFVNEVERGCLVSLFGSLADGRNPAYRIGDQTREVLVQKLVDYYR